MTLTLSELERISHHQSVELCREERRFLARLHNLGLLRRHCNELSQQRDKIEKLSSLHDKLLQQEFSLRKFRRIRSEVDSQRQKNEKLAKELGKVKDEVEDKETKLQAAKANIQKVISIANEKQEKLNSETNPAIIAVQQQSTQLEVRKPLVSELQQNGINGTAITNGKNHVAPNGNNNDAKIITAVKPVLPIKPLLPSTTPVTNGGTNVINGNGTTSVNGPSTKVAVGTNNNNIIVNGSSNNGTNGTGNNNNSDSDEIATSFITGWAPKTNGDLKNGRPAFTRHSTSDVELSSNGYGENNLAMPGDNSDANSSSSPSSSFVENVRPASDFIAHASLPAYRYVPRTQTFMRRIGVDGGRKKTVESLYKDFHPRALQSATTKSTPVSIIEEVTAANESSITAVSSTTVFEKTGSGAQSDDPAEVFDKNRRRVRSILVVNRTVIKRTAERRVRFDPLALLLDAALDGDLDLVKQLLIEVPNAANAANDEGITALHNAVCAGHSEMVELLVEYGVDVNAADTDGWTGLHCAASCNNKALCQLLVENGAALLALTTSDRETARDKCEPDEDGFAECYAYLLEAEEQLGRANDGVVYAAFDLKRADSDEEGGTTLDVDVLQFDVGAKLKVLRRGDAMENDWWWGKLLPRPINSDVVVIVNGSSKEGYVPNSYLALWPRNQSFWERHTSQVSG